jgi:hypothetical protein
VRDLCVFAAHDVTRDPPYSRIDRDLLQRPHLFRSRASEKAVALLQYALAPGGSDARELGESSRRGRSAHRSRRSRHLPQASGPGLHGRARRRGEPCGRPSRSRSAPVLQRPGPEAADADDAFLAALARAGARQRTMEITAFGETSARSSPWSRETSRSTSRPAPASARSWRCCGPRSAGRSASGSVTRRNLVGWRPASPCRST